MPPRSHQTAFSLIELLTVMAIIGLLAALAIPAVNSISGSQSTRRCAHDIAGLLEYARSEATTRQTYVWVGFSVTNSSGVNEILEGAVFSKDGSGTNFSPSNLGSLSRVIHSGKVTIVNWNDLRTETRASVTNVTPTGIDTNAAGISFSIGNTAFSGKTITFTPHGEATVVGSVTTDDGFDPSIAISFRQSRGGSSTNGQEGAVLLNGATGMPSIINNL